MASSAVELVRAPLEEVAAAEVEPLVTGPSSWVADNLAAVAEAVGQAPAGPLAVATLLAWHARLMAHAGPEGAGRLRDRLVWVGGATPPLAAYVGPPPGLVPGLLEDLVAFCNRADLDAVTQAAVAHAQFESIHPFADGNGRLGRVLIAWVVARRLEVPVPPPLSVFIARTPAATSRASPSTGSARPRPGCGGSPRRSSAPRAPRPPWSTASRRSSPTGAGAPGPSRARDARRRDALAAPRAASAYPVVSGALVARECGVTDEAARHGAAPSGRAGRPRAGDAPSRGARPAVRVLGRQRDPGPGGPDVDLTSHEDGDPSRP